MNHHQSNLESTNHSTNNQKNKTIDQDDLKEIKDLLQKNLVLSQELKKMMKFVHKYVLWQRIIGVAKIALFILAIVAAFIYLPPFLKDFMGQMGAIYNQLLNLANNPST